MSFEEFQNRINDPDFKLTSLSTSLVNNNKSTETKSTGFGGEMVWITRLWRMAKRQGADYCHNQWLSVGNAENWSLSIYLWAPRRYVGWRKYTKKLADWLLAL